MGTIVKVRKDDIGHPNNQSYPEHFSPKAFGVIVFPTGIENGGKHKEKQDLSDTPKNPFRL
jgi:hypothetical protein